MPFSKLYKAATFGISESDWQEHRCGRAYFDPAYLTYCCYLGLATVWVLFRDNRDCETVDKWHEKLNHFQKSATSSHVGVCFAYCTINQPSSKSGLVSDSSFSGPRKGVVHAFLRTLILNYDFLANGHHRQTLCCFSLLFATKTKEKNCANYAPVKCFELVD
jgi:hypothetical protein